METNSIVTSHLPVILAADDTALIIRYLEALLHPKVEETSFCPQVRWALYDFFFFFLFFFFFFFSLHQEAVDELNVLISTHKTPARDS
jgi:hypothetical protein